MQPTCVLSDVQEVQQLYTGTASVWLNYLSRPQSDVYWWNIHSKFYTTELCVMYWALLFIWHQSWRYYLFTDSLSAFQCLSGHSSDHPITIKILIQVSHLHRAGKSVYFAGYPATLACPATGTLLQQIKTASHGALAFDWALDSDVCAFLCCAILSLWQDE
jgi:hypothetical protein